MKIDKLTVLLVSMVILVVVYIASAVVMFEQERQAFAQENPELYQQKLEQFEKLEAGDLIVEGETTYIVKSALNLNMMEVENLSVLSGTSVRLSKTRSWEYEYFQAGTSEWRDKLADVFTELVANYSDHEVEISVSNGFAVQP